MGKTVPLPEHPVRVLSRRSGDNGAVCWLTLSNPELRNALDDPMQQELIATLQALGADDSVRCVVVRGAGDLFCSGGDIGLFQGMNPEKSHWFSVHRGEALQKAVAQLGKPLIAAVDGWCLAGGCELLLMADFAYATARARFGLTEIRIGLLPGWGGITRLPLAVGLRRAREMLYRGEIVDSAEAQTLGLVNRSFETADALYAAAEETAQEIAAKSSAAVRTARELTALASGRNDAVACALERGAMVHLASSTDAREGVSAFLEKRSPRFNQTS